MHVTESWPRLGRSTAFGQMKYFAKNIGENWRGGRASLRFLAAAPIVNAQVALRAKDREDARDMFARHFRRFLDTCQVSVSLDGEFPEPGKGCILCYNETSFVDVAAYCVSMWPYVDRAAAADLYAYFPFARAAFRKAAIEMVPRGNREATDQLLERMVSAAKQGERVAWGGEGRLSGKDGVGRFKIGASLIAIRAQVPVIPVVFQGGHHAMPLGTFRARPGEVRIRFCKSVPTAGYVEADAREFADRLQAEFVRIYRQLAEKRPALA